MNNHPFIGKFQSSIRIFFNHGSSAVIDSGHGVTRHESNFKNITAEYLANTYGEVKSKEHAEFIVKLATNHGYELLGPIKECDAGTFVIDGDSKMLFFMRGINFLGDSVVKKITIPLPPECESVDEWPKVGSIVEWGHTGKGEVKSLSDGFAWIKLDNKDYTTVYVSSLRKPKKPEQELRDEISDLAFNQFNDDSYDLTHNSYYLAEQLISKYDITKKPQ